MARLRIRIELSKGGLGVPLHKVASVVSKSQQFLDLLGEDIKIDRNKGEWLGFDFDRESLNFTAEYIGAVSPEQARAFNAAFDGTTSLRRVTIAQFASITEAIGEDEIIGFGLYQSDEVEEPTEWRCLSRRDALRIAEGIQMLLESDRESHLPAVGDPQLGARIFGDRRDIGADYAREIEKSLSERMDRVETQMERHSELIQNLHAHSVSTETSVRNLLTTVESFCNQATRRIEMATPIPLPAVPVPPEAPKQSSKWRVIAGVGILAASTLALVLFASTRPSSTAKTGAFPKVEASIPSKPEPESQTKPLPEPAKGTPAAPTSNLPLRIQLSASAPTWVSLVDSDGNRLLATLLNPESEPRALELTKDATLVTGNAGGLVLRVNGEQLSSLGPTGQVRQVHFKDGRVLPVAK